MKIGTRGSPLALWQAREVRRRIAETGGPACELVVIRTSGDETSGPPEAPASSGTPNLKRLFVKEIEEALLDGRIDLAVHSAKDLTVDLPGGLTIGAALPREDARDAVVLPNSEAVSDLETLQRWFGREPRIGTSSVRRAASLATIFRGATFVPMRGNVDTRLRKLDAGECDATVLASAGLIRLGLAGRISLALPIDACVPAPGQGIMAIELREDRPDVLRAIGAIGDRDAMDALTAERAVVQTLGGGCQMPLGAYAHVEREDVSLNAIVVALDGRRAIRHRARDSRARAAQLGESVGRRLLEQGAAELLGA